MFNDHKKDLDFNENYNKIDNNKMLKNTVNKDKFNPSSLNNIEVKDDDNLSKSDLSNYFVEDNHNDNNNNLKELLNINNDNNSRLKNIVREENKDLVDTTKIREENNINNQVDNHIIYQKEENTFKSDAKELLKNQTSKLKNIDYKTKTFIVTYIILAIVFTLVTGLFGSWDVAKIVLLFFFLFGIVVGLFYILFVKFKDKNDRR